MKKASVWVEVEVRDSRYVLISVIVSRLVRVDTRLASSVSRVVVSSVRVVVYVTGMRVVRVTVEYTVVVVTGTGKQSSPMHALVAERSSNRTDATMIITLETSRSQLLSISRASRLLLSDAFWATA